MFNSLLRLVLSEAATPVGFRAGIAVGRAQFVARVARWHALLQAHGGQRFALYQQDSIEFAAVLFAAWHAGKTVWLSADTLPSGIAALREQVDGFIGDFPADCDAIREPSATGSALPLPALHGDFTGLVVHTSGSTGQARAIPKKLAQLASEVATLEQLFAARMGDAAIVATVSHQHIYGLLFKVLWPLAAGRALHAETILYPEQLPAHLEHCVLISSPAHLKRLPAHLDWPGARLIFCSGGVLSAESAMACRAMLGQTPIEVYGSSETGGVAVRQRRDAGDDGWSAMPGVEWRIAEQDELIEVRSPHLFDRDWLRLSDQVARLAPDRFRLKGRADRIVKIEEKRIALNALERQLLDSGLVAEVRLVVTVAGVRQHLAAVLVLSETGRARLRSHGRLAMNRQLKDCLRAVAEPVALPRAFRYVEQLPQDAQGKTTEALLLALFAREAPESVSAPLYTLIRRDAGHAELDVHWLRGLHCFVGHFPDAPVLPGVAQVHWALHIARELFDMPDNFRAMHALKFQHVVRPDEITRLVLQYDRNKASLSFAFTTPARQHSSGRILFHQGDPA